MKLARVVAWRLGAALVVLWLAASLCFAALNLSGGDPALAAVGGPEALPSPEVLERARQDFGLDQPLPVQYARYLQHLLQGDLGESYQLRVPVARAIGEQLGATLQLSLAGVVLALLLAVTTALLTAGRGRLLTGLSSGTELVLSSMPTFVLGILLLLLFAIHWRWLPPTGSSGWRALVLPALALALPLAAMLAQVLRRELEEVLEQPFIAMARARGLSEAGVRLGHALRHVLTPLITLTGFILAFLISGAVITETLFARQGIGRLLLDAVNAKDAPMVLGISLLSALIYVLVNLLVDLLNLWVDPRVAR